jgi:hypothetical protein
MKIAISELEPQESIYDLDLSKVTTITGGATEVEILTQSFAEGDLAVTKSGANVYKFQYKTKGGVYDISFGFGYALAASFTANPA